MPNETAPNELGEVAVGVGDNSYPDRVEDVEKAHEMALAGDENRTNAAVLRDGANTVLNYPEDTSVDKTQIDEHPVATEGLYDVKGNFYQSPGLASSEMRRASDEQDKQAERLVAWAGVLHEHPISDAYKEAHRGVDFSPETLVGLEDSVELDNKKLDVLRKWLSSEITSSLTAKATELLTGLQPSSVETNGDPEIKRALDMHNMKLYDQTFSHELWEMGEDATLADLRKAIVASVQRTYIKPKESSIALRGKLLEDVRSGIASEQSSEG